MSKDQDVQKDTQSAKDESQTMAKQNSPGQQLSRAREALGLSQEDVANKLHLRLNSVIAVENDALEKGVSVTFNKGYVRLYARLVNLDPQSLLEAYDELHAVDRQQPAKLQSFSRRVSREAHDSRWNMVTIVVVILVLGSVIAWWVQQPDSADDSQNIVANTFDNLFGEKDNSSSSDSAQDTNVTLSEQVDNNIVETKEALNSAENNVNSVNDNELADQVEELDPFAIVDDVNNGVSNIDTDLPDIIEDAEDMIVGNQDTTPVDIENDSLPVFSQQLAAQGYEVNDNGTIDLVFTFRDDCWVSVKDVNGETMAIGVKVKGRVMEVSGLPPISIILGAPQFVDINFGGQDVDMSVHPAGRSANFQLPLESE